MAISSAFKIAERLSFEGKSLQAASLLNRVAESTDDPEYMSEVAARGIRCGTQVCNYGVANSGTSLDKSVEDQGKPKDLP